MDGWVVESKRSSIYESDTLPAYEHGTLLFFCRGVCNGLFAWNLSMGGGYMEFLLNHSSLEVSEKLCTVCLLATASRPGRLSSDQYLGRGE